MDWRRERYVWVPSAHPGTLQALGLEAQALVAYLARLCDERGVIRCASDDRRRALTKLCGTHLAERMLFAKVVDESFRVGTLAAHAEGVHLPEFAAWQVTREPRRRLYERESLAFAQLPTFTRALAAHLVRVSDEGIIRCARPEEWVATVTRGQYDRVRFDRAMGHRVASHLDTLFGVGFLDRTEQGFAIRHHLEAQHPAPRPEALDRPQGGPRVALDRPQGGPRVALGSELSVQNHSTAVGTPVPSLPPVPSNPPLMPPLAAEAAPVVAAQPVPPNPPPRVSRPAAGRPSPRNEVQGVLFGVLDPPAAKPVPAVEVPKRRAKVKPPTEDVPLGEGEPGYEAFRLIVDHPMLSKLVDKPGEFVRSAQATYDAIDLRYQLGRAGEYLLGARHRTYSDGRRFLRPWLDEAQQKAQHQAKIAAVLRGVGLSGGAEAVPAAAPKPTGRARFAEANACDHAVPVTSWTRAEAAR